MLCFGLLWKKRANATAGPLAELTGQRFVCVSVYPLFEDTIRTLGGGPLLGKICLKM